MFNVFSLRKWFFNWFQFSKEWHTFLSFIFINHIHRYVSVHAFWATAHEQTSSYTRCNYKRASFHRNASWNAPESCSDHRMLHYRIHTEMVAPRIGYVGSASESSDWSVSQMIFRTRHICCFSRPYGFSSGCHSTLCCWTLYRKQYRRTAFHRVNAKVDLVTTGSEKGFFGILAFDFRKYLDVRN